MSTSPIFLPNIEEIALIPEWARSRPRDPKVTRALVSTASTRSDLLRSLLAPGRLIHCYCRTGYGLEAWMTRMLANVNQLHWQTLDLCRNGMPFQQQMQALGSIDKSPKTKTLVLLRLDRLESHQLKALITVLPVYKDHIALVLTSSQSPAAVLMELRFFYECIHLGENQLHYTVADYEKLTLRWQQRPARTEIEATLSRFDGWPEPCLRSLCAACDSRIPSGNTSAFETYYPGEPNEFSSVGQQWIATFLLTLPLPLLQLLVSAHQLPIITPETLDLCEPNQQQHQLGAGMTIDDFDSRRQQRSGVLTELCNMLILQQFTHPRLHFRWSTSEFQLILGRLIRERGALERIGLHAPEQFDGLTVQLTKLYMDHDYIHEIISLSKCSADSSGLHYLIAKQPGQVIDYLRGNTAGNRPTLALFGIMQNTANQLASFLQKKFYWQISNGDGERPINLASPAALPILTRAQPILDLIDRYEFAQTMLVAEGLKEGMRQLEHVFIAALDERCFSVAAPVISLIGLTDLLCINKLHLRKTTQAIDHCETLIDPQSQFPLIDWTDLCASPLQILSTHGESLSKRLSQTHQNFAGQLPEEAFLFYEWVHCLSLTYRDEDELALQRIDNLLTRLKSHHRQLQTMHRNPLKSPLPQTLLLPWLGVGSLVKLLAELMQMGKYQSRQLRLLGQQLEPLFLIADYDQDKPGIWQLLPRVIKTFLQAAGSQNSQALEQLEQLTQTCQSMGFRLVWIISALLTSAVLWHNDQEERSLQYFYDGAKFAEQAGLHDLLLPMAEFLHPQIRKAQQQNIAPLLIAKAVAHYNKKTRNKDNQLERLSKRELEILGFINLGMSNEDIADHLCRAKGTVKLHVHNIYKKLEIRNRIEAIQLYNQYKNAEA